MTASLEFLKDVHMELHFQSKIEVPALTLLWHRLFPDGENSGLFEPGPTTELNGSLKHQQSKQVNNPNDNIILWHESTSKQIATGMLVTPQHNTTQHNTTQHNTTQHNTTQHNTTQHNTTQHNTTQHNTTQHNTTQHNTTQHNTTQHNTTQHNWLPYICKGHQEVFVPETQNTRCSLRIIHGCTYLFNNIL